MQPLPDESEFEWIRKTRGVLLHPEEPRLSPIEGPGIFVSDLVPPEFEAYARITSGHFALPPNFSTAFLRFPVTNNLY